MAGDTDDHAAIRNLFAKYCLHLDLDDVESWIDLFTPDATYQVYGRTWSGREHLRDMAAAAPGGFHLGGPVMIDLAGDMAHTTRNLQFVDRATGRIRYAVYEDELVRTSEGWRIARCRCRFHTPDGLADRPPRA